MKKLVRLSQYTGAIQDRRNGVHVKSESEFTDLRLEVGAAHAGNATTRIALLQILEDRYGKQAIIVTSQLPVSKWYDVINDPTLADALMDRLTANAHRIELEGETLRRKKS